ncbi:TonB-dependent receptor [Govanella unica]|uniref:TonB-dependent receptor n=1 Tax=Govanella unica TaxID=2975056 RepID=A0A9X3TZH0_9PROT|nr:TonB-dependent receptor [Govania unica]MDA5194547.1 TonB-dependent receptor [Govania unica]
MRGNISTYRRGFLSGTVSMLAFLAAVPAVAVAAESGQSVASAGFEEILVTARKRGEERLQDIPATITALGSGTLEQMGALNFADFAYQVPGLTFSDEGAGQKRYVLRGVRSAGQEQVAVYYDEVPVPGIQGAGGDSGSQTTDLKIFDIDRVEVLKGPQGSTFGANSQAGTVRFIMKKPVMNEVQGQIKVGANKIQDGGTGANVYGMFNAPLVTDKLSLRAIAYYDREAGYIDNVRLGQNNINWQQTTGFRGMLRFQPTDNLTVDAMAWLENRKSGGSNRYNPYDSFSASASNLDFVNNNLQPLSDIRRIAYFQTGDLKVGDYTRSDMPDDQQIYSLTMNWDLDWASLVATGSVYKRDYGFKRDSTWVLLSLGVRPNGFPGITPARPDLLPALTDQTQSIEQKAFEMRLNSNPGSKFQWMGGFFYRDRASSFRSYVPVVDPVTGMPYDPGVPPTGYIGPVPGTGLVDCNPCATARVNDRKIKEIAFFGEATYAVTEQFEAMVGARWFQSKQSDLGSTTFPFALFAQAPLPEADARTFKESKPILKFQLSYRLDEDKVLYALASQGYRLGGTNQQGIVAVPLGYGADSLWNYEVGTKTAWLDRRLILNLSAFLIKWKDIQVSGRDPSGAFGFIGNAGAAEIRGLEAELQARPAEGFDITAGLSWLPKRELTKDQITDQVVAPGRAGDKLPFIPAFTANVAAQYSYDLAVADWSGFVRAEYAFHGKSNSELSVASRHNRVQNSYDIVNARAGFMNTANDLDVTFYVENVFNSRGDVRVRAEDSLLTFKWTNTPRNFGIDVTKKF